MQLDKKAFVEQAINTSCDAFFREDFFSFQEGEAGQEHYPELSCGKSLPEWATISEESEMIQGQYNYLTSSATDLWLVCSYYAEKGEDYFVFYDVNDLDNQDANGWVIWLPNEKHMN